jgi:hypothetical protein
VPSSASLSDVSQSAHGSPAVDGTLSASAPESSPADSRKWIGRIVIAVLLGEAIWGFLVSITNNLALPAMARAMGGDSQSPMYLGKGDFNVQGLFASVLELCFAGIMAVLLNSWSQKRGRVPRKPVLVTSVEAPPVPVVTPLAPSPVTPAADTATQEAAAPVSVPSAPQPSPSLQIAKPAKPKPTKAVYYNIVGEPVDTDDE